jgi:purine-nucleoside phosphorylase
MLETPEHLSEAADYVQANWPTPPRAGIVLGSGLGDLADAVEDPVRIDYETIPHFPHSTALGHHGRLVCGHLAEVAVVVMQGRFHRYEGYSLDEVTRPIRVMALLGIDILIVSNAAGGVNPAFSAGDAMILSGHINRMGTPPLVGPGEPYTGLPRRAAVEPYDPNLIEQARSIARCNNFEAPLGVYAGNLGPNYETRAEYRYLRRIGADAVGMSTIPEVLVSAASGVRNLALSAITNVCLPDALGQTTAEHVLETAARAGGKISKIIHGVLESLAQNDPRRSIRS